MNDIIKILCFLYSILLFSCGNPSQTKQAYQRVIKPDSGLISDSGMVVCARAEASKVGIDILKKGGNAIDAAVAVQFALAVVYP